MGFLNLRPDIVHLFIRGGENHVKVTDSTLVARDSRSNCMMGMAFRSTEPRDDPPMYMTGVNENETLSNGKRDR